MKNKGLIILIFSVMIISLASIIFVFGLKTMDYNLFNKKWYHYDYKNGYFDMINFDENGFKYYKPNDENITNEYSFCSNYTYNKFNKTIKLDCGKQIDIIKISSDVLRLNIDSKEVLFYTNIDDTINNEFKKYYSLSIDEYKNKYKQALDIIKVEGDEIFNLLKEEEYSKIIFIGNNCNTVSCALVKDVIEKWISFSKNIYYVDSNELNNEVLSKLNKSNSKFSLDKSVYNDIYPIVYVIGNNDIVDTYKIECNGFDCSNNYNK